MLRMSCDELAGMAWTSASVLRRAVALVSATAATAATTATKSQQAHGEGRGGRGQGASACGFSDQEQARWLKSARAWREGVSCQMARLWRIRDRLHVLRGAAEGAAGGPGHVFSLLREQQVREMRQEVLSIYGALRAIPDISLSILL